MSDIAKREFEVLAVDSNNYLTWATDVEIKLDGMSLDHTIVHPEAGKDERTKPDKARALHFLRHHLHSDLKSEYMTERDPLVLWQSLKDRFGQQLTIVLPRAQQAWITLRFEDYKSVAVYNSALHGLSSTQMLKTSIWMEVRKTFSMTWIFLGTYSNLQNIMSMRCRVWPCS
jgi:hypothetical protein